jgi:DnaK suppressor protein
MRHQTREALTAKLAEIDAEMAEMEKPPTEQGSISFGKRIGEGTSMAIDRMAQVAVHDRLQVTRADVVRAMAKLEEGTYGTCDECGRPIPEGRLEALPWAVLCVEDAGKRVPR